MQQSRFAIDETLSIEAPLWYRDVELGSTVFEGGVVARYGATVLKADRVEVDAQRGWLRAIGKTEIIDPEATISANGVEVWWREKQSIAQDVRFEVGYVRVTGKSLETFGDPEPLWVVRGAEIVLTDLGGSKFAADEIEVQPGKRAVARRVFYHLAGQKIGPIPSQTINLDRRVSGLKFPSVTNRRGIGVGVSWESSLLLNDQTVFQGSMGSFPKRLLTSSFQVTQSFIAGSKQMTKVSPRGDLGERFADGWFNNVGIPTPEDEWGRIRDPKASWSMGTFWNVGTTARPLDFDGVSKAFELVGEFGGGFGDLAWVGTTRVQRVRPSTKGAWVDRAVADFSLLAPRFNFGGGWSTHARIDFFGTAGGSNQYGFARAELGVFGPVFPGLTAGFAFSKGGEFGTSDFAFDRLGVLEGMHFRADYQRGPYTVRYLAKYDLRSDLWFDREWEIALAAGSLEPFVVRREFPGDYRFGLRFRTDAFTNRLLDRDLKRKTPPPNNGSGD